MAAKEAKNGAAPPIGNVTKSVLPIRHEASAAPSRCQERLLDACGRQRWRYKYKVCEDVAGSTRQREAALNCEMTSLVKILRVALVQAEMRRRSQQPWFIAYVGTDTHNYMYHIVCILHSCRHILKAIAYDRGHEDTPPGGLALASPTVALILVNFM